MRALPICVRTNHPTRRHTDTKQAFASIYRAGGLVGLYVGWQPTMVRAACLAGAQLSGYDHSKHLLKDNGVMVEGTTLHLTSSVR